MPNHKTKGAKMSKTEAAIMESVKPNREYIVQIASGKTIYSGSRKFRAVKSLIEKGLLDEVRTSHLTIVYRLNNA